LRKGSGFAECVGGTDWLDDVSVDGDEGGFRTSVMRARTESAQISKLERVAFWTLRSCGVGSFSGVGIVAVGVSVARVLLFSSASSGFGLTGLEERLTPARIVSIIEVMRRMSSPRSSVERRETRSVS